MTHDQKRVVYHSTSLLARRYAKAERESLNAAWLLIGASQQPARNLFLEIMGLSNGDD